LTRGECTPLPGWLDALPDDLVRSRPRLGVFHAWALAFAGQLDGAESCLAHVDVQHVQGEVAAVSTVKSHVNHIFGKLGVESRTQAVARAQGLGLL
jgi:ATP/maltotriose-dependent transcriptional regulator MalT